MASVTPTRAERIRLADMARAYYLENASKVELAGRFGVSRFQVARMLEEALATGVVSITIRDPRPAATDREEQVARLLGVTAVRIVEDASGGTSADAERVGVAVMDVLEESIRPGMTIGVSWSRTLDLAAKLLPELPPCDLVQLAGVLQMPGAGGLLPRVIAQLGRRPGVRTFPIYAPLVVGTKATADDLVSQPELAGALERADALDLAVVAIGAWEEGESSVWEKVPPAVRRECREAGAVAEISGRLLDADGRPVHTPLDDRLIGVRIEQLRRAGDVIGFSRGACRTVAVRAAVRSGVVDTLVLDAPLATALLAEGLSEPARDRRRA